MAHRVGVCQSCRARFQIPASFAPKHARCRSCGGVVEIGSAQGATDPVSARATPSKEPVARSPAPVEARARELEPAVVLARPAPTAALPVEAPRRRNGIVRLLVVVGIVVILALCVRSLFGNRGGSTPAGAEPAPSNAPGSR